jgi:hypothetical protein
VHDRREIRFIRFYRTFELNGVDMLTYPECLHGLWMEVRTCPRICYTTFAGFGAMRV